MAYPKRTRDQHFKEDGPKRILALDGGGLRGILTLGILNQIEDELRRRHGKEKEFRLCHYFDLIAGTSTGAIIAATLAIGWSVEEITKKYFELGARVEKLEGDLQLVCRSSATFAITPTSAALNELLGEKEANTLPLENLSAMDSPENMQALHRIGLVAGERQVQAEHFPAVFNL